MCKIGRECVCSLLLSLFLFLLCFAIGCGGGAQGGAQNPQNPVPTLSGLSPNSAIAGSGALSLTATGGGFVAGAVIQWNGAVVTTNYVSSTSLTAQIPASDVSSAGTATVTVRNPMPGGGTSSAMTFTVNTPPPTPSITSLSPTSVNAGSSAFGLTVMGTDFISSSQVMWNGSQVPTTYVSSTSLTAQIPASDVSSAGAVSVKVQNPMPDGGTSSAAIFTVYAPEILYGANLSNSIFALEVDQRSGALTQTASVSPGGNSVNNSILAVTPSGTFVYAVNDVVAGINGYATNASGTLALISGSPFAILPSIQPSWPGVAALAIDPRGRFLYAGSGAGFGGVASFSIDATSGALSPTGGPFSTFSATVAGGNPAGIAIDPTGTFLYASDQYQSVWGFTIDAQSGVLAAIAGSPFAAGNQPKGLQVDPSGKHLYVTLSNSNSIAAFNIDKTTGVLTQVVGSPFATAPAQFTQTYSLTIHPSGKFLYAFNFNGNTVAAFTIDPNTGGLTTIAGAPFAVTPNAEGDLIVEPSGKYLYLAVGYGPPSAFVIFDINPISGVLTQNAQSPFAGSQEVWGLAVVSFPKP